MSVSVVSPVFIGRRQELASLATLLGQAAERVPAFALIGGEAGVGKTRLVRELTGSAAGLGFLVLTGQCVELGAEGLPLAPLVDALRTLSRVMPPDELATILGPAGASLARLLPELTPADGPAPGRGDLHRRPPLRPLLASWERTRGAGHLELQRFDRNEVPAQLAAILGHEPAPDA